MGKLDTGADDKLSSDHGKDTPSHRTSENICLNLLKLTPFRAMNYSVWRQAFPKKGEVEEVNMSLSPSLGGVVSFRQSSFSASAVVSQECMSAVVKAKTSLPLSKLS